MVQFLCLARGTRTAVIFLFHLLQFNNFAPKVGAHLRVRPCVRPYYRGRHVGLPLLDDLRVTPLTPFPSPTRKGEAARS